MAANDDDDICDNDHRVVLLLDLDCFYAQAMCIRLGYDAATTPLALFQWNSVLAVTYPARTQYSIKRGDSWDAVRSKSNGECLCVHVPILTTTTTTANSNGDEEQEHLQDVDDNADFESTSKNTPGRSSTIEQEYRDYFLLNPDQQQAARRRELGVRRYCQDGKASIECFRIASARILSLVKTFLREQYKNDKKDRVCILERASIDEFFLDVTTAASAAAVVENNSKTDDDPGSSALLLPMSTVIIGGEDDNSNNVKTLSVAAADGTERKSRGGGNDHDEDDNDGDEDEEEVMADIRLARGCRIADQIRTRVREELNFTLTAGISINKTIAKLAATYGKPNGQAVCFPRSIATMLRATPISKCRNLGGKLGALVEQVLRAETTGSPATTVAAAAASAPAPAMVGDIVRHLSLSRLLQCGHFSEPTARWIWQIAHGRDHEPVQAKDQTAVLTKSITAFKSLNFGYDDAQEENNQNNSNNKNGHLLGDTTPWIRLLAQEVVDRVTRDEQRNHRYPKNCVIQYTTSRNITRSVRIPFPSHKWSNRQKQDHLVTMVPKTVATKEKDRNVRLRRIGICATDFFEQRPAGTSIERFFTEEACCTAAAATAAVKTTTTTTTPPSPARPGSKLRDNVAAAAAAGSTTVVANTNNDKDDEDAVDESSSSSTTSDRDLALARSLQAKYDREEQSMRLLESRKRKKSAGCIDSFFSKRAASASAAKK
jgi:nucleotidyltransferase/DNA polymerase involved in DNA repair